MASNGNDMVMNDTAELERRIEKNLVEIDELGRRLRITGMEREELRIETMGLQRPTHSADLMRRKRLMQIKSRDLGRDIAEVERKTAKLEGQAKVSEDRDV